MKIYSYLYIFLNIFILPLPGYSQKGIQVELGQTVLSPGQPFELRLVVPGMTDRPEVVFPVLPGMEKGSTVLTRKTEREQDKPVFVQTIVQQYFPAKPVNLTVPSSVVLVDGEKILVEGFYLQISAATADTLQVQEAEIVPDELTKGDVFLTLRVNKTAVYIREGFGAYLSLFVAKDVPLIMDFYDLDNQLQRILKILKPEGCWEENTWIEEIKPRTIQIGERVYTEYRLYQSVFYPIAEKTVVFPSVGLKMRIGDGNSEEGEEIRLRSFHTRQITINVRPLPPHPRRDLVAVGTYRMSDSLSNLRVAAGESFKYLFRIEGEGNIPAIPAPAIPPVQAFDFYPPEVHQTLHRGMYAIWGEKVFEYNIVAKQNGLFPLQGYFQWIYFDASLGRYDTLRSTKVVEVIGEAVAKDPAVRGGGETSLYANLELLHTDAGFRNYGDVFRIIMNVVVILMLLVAIWIFRK